MLTHRYFDRPVSLLGFGAMRFPQKDGVTDQEATNALIRTALDHGVNYFDTAYAYGDGANERALSEALRASGYPRESYMIADKLPFWKVGCAEDMEKVFCASMENLGTEYIDCYLLHAMNAEAWEKAVRFGALEWVQEKKERGLVRHIGFSIHDSRDCLVKILDSFPWEFVQIQLNFLDEKDRPGLEGYTELRRRNLPVIIMEPQKGGLLSDLPERISAPFRALGGSNASYAFRWLCEKPGLMTILSGMSAMPQLTENLSIFADPAPLSEAEHRAVEAVRENIRAAERTGCTGCGYCQPCPKGIRIPDIFRAWNRRALGAARPVNPAHIEAALSCVRCRSCESHCPQKLPICDKLAEFAAEAVQSQKGEERA